MPGLYVIPELGRTDRGLVNGNVLTNGKALKGCFFSRFIFFCFGSYVVDV